jgi:hypothetical protein
MFNYYYDFLYVPIYTNRLNTGSTSSITLNGNDLSMYSYEFVVDDRNIGGTIHIDFESRIAVRQKELVWNTILIIGFYSLLYHRM